MSNSSTLVIRKGKWIKVILYSSFIISMVILVFMIKSEKPDDVVGVSILYFVISITGLIVLPEFFSRVKVTKRDGRIIIRDGLPLVGVKYKLDAEIIKSVRTKRYNAGSPGRPNKIISTTYYGLQNSAYNNAVGKGSVYSIQIVIGSKELIEIGKYVNLKKANDISNFILEKN